MDIATLEALRSPAGVPSHPLIFQVLGVITWALHIMAVHVTLGAFFVSLLAMNRGGPQASYWQRLAEMLLSHAKVGVSIAIVLGVAPLLFVQVIYDPFWYVSNVLSARWAIGFIVALLIAYWLLWLHYARVHRNADPGTAKPIGLGWASFLLLLGVGFVMHVLSSQMLHPEQWQAWYAPNGAIDASGSRIHDYHLGRYAFFIALSLPVTGAWLLACRQYLAGRDGEDSAYVDFIRQPAQRLLIWGGLLAFAALLLWQLTLPPKAQGFLMTPWPALAALGLAMLMALGYKLRSGYAVAGLALLADLTVGVLREGYRLSLLKGVHGYDPLAYPVNMDWYSTVLFFVTFAVVGGLALSFMLSLAWQSGRVQGVYTASRTIDRLANWTLVASLAWVVQYFAFGAWVMLRG